MVEKRRSLIVTDRKAQERMEQTLWEIPRIVDQEVCQLLQYMVRDVSWSHCFSIIVNVDGLIERLRSKKLIGKFFQPTGDEAWDKALRDAVTQVVLQRGLRAYKDGYILELTEKEEDKTNGEQRTCFT